MGIVERECIQRTLSFLAFFTVVASCSNLSTSFSGTKLVQGKRKRKFQRENVKKTLAFSLLSEAEIQ